MLARYLLLAMAVIVFGVAIASVLCGAYLAGLLTVIALVAVYLVGMWKHVENLHLPFGIEIRLGGRRRDE